MILSRTVATLALSLPIVVAAPGCDVQTVKLVLQNPQFQAALVWVAKEAAAYLVRGVFLPAIIDAVTRDAVAATPQQIVDQVSNAEATKAFEGFVTHRTADSVQLRFDCKLKELAQDCEERFRQQMLEMTQAQARQFDQAFRTCRESAAHDSAQVDVLRQAEGIEHCVSNNGFADQVATIRLMYSRT